MHTASIAAWVALALTWIAAFRGIGRWSIVSTGQRWFALFLVGSGVIGTAMAIMAVLKVPNWVLGNAWSAWCAFTLGPALSQRLGALEKKIAQGLFIAWLVFWLIARMNTGFSAWSSYLHPALCGLILAVGMVALDVAVKDDLPFWENGVMLMIAAACLMGACDAVTWGCMKYYSSANKETFVAIWAARNLAMVPVSAIFLRTFQVAP